MEGSKPISPEVCMFPKAEVDFTKDTDIQRKVAQNVQANVQNKLHGTTGGTIVARHSGVRENEATVRTVVRMRELQQDIAKGFGTLVTSLPKGSLPEAVTSDPARAEDLAVLEQEGPPRYYEVHRKPSGGVEYTPATDQSTGIVLVRSLHTTAISQFVVDTTRGKEGWDDGVAVTKYYRAAVHFFDHAPPDLVVSIEGEDSPLTPSAFIERLAACKNEEEARHLIASSNLGSDQKEAIEKEAHEPFESDPAELDEVGEFTLTATQVKVTDNGSLVVQWGESEKLAELKHTLVDYGGVAKRGLKGKATATTLGYFPYYHNMSKETRADIQDHLSKFVESHPGAWNITIKPSDLRAVRFERNDLNEHFAKFEGLVDTQGKVSDVAGKYHKQRAPSDSTRPPAQ